MNYPPTVERDRDDLEAAALGLVQASRLLSDSILSDSDELIETAYVVLRVAKAKFAGAIADYRNQSVEAALAA